MLAIVACQTVDADRDRAARIVDPTDASRLALSKAVNAALKSDVTLADDALTESSVLVIERVMPRRIDGAPAQGRIMEPPIQFRLVKVGSNCVLVDQGNGLRYRLDDTDCVGE